MKNIMKTMILGFLVLTLALSFTSCSDKEDDPKPSNPTELTLSDFVGDWITTSVEVDGQVRAVCDKEWGSITAGRKLDLSISNINNDGNLSGNSSVVSYGCTINDEKSSINQASFYNDSKKELTIGGFIFKIDSFNNDTFKATLIGRPNLSFLLNVKYDFKKE